MENPRFQAFPPSTLKRLAQDHVIKTPVGKVPRLGVQVSLEDGEAPLDALDDFLLVDLDSVSFHLLVLFKVEEKVPPSAAPTTASFCRLLSLFLPIARQLRLTFSSLAWPSEPELFPFVQGAVVIFVTMARFLRPLFRHGRSVSSSASRADCSLPGVVPLLRAFPHGV